MQSRLTQQYKELSDMDAGALPKYMYAYDKFMKARGIQKKPLLKQVIASEQEAAKAVDSVTRLNALEQSKKSLELNLLFGMDT